MSNPTITPGPALPGLPSAPRPLGPRLGRLLRRGQFMGLQRRVALSLAALLIALTVLGIVVSTLTLRQSLDEAFQNKGTAIAGSLASVTPGYLASADLSQLQSQLDDYAKVEGVAYVLVTDAQDQVLAHTFVPFVPAAVLETEQAEGARRTGVEDASQMRFSYQDPETGKTRNVLNIDAPLSGGYLGEVRVGMDMDVIAAQETRAALLVAGALLAAGLLALLGATAFARRMVRPIEKLAFVSERVAQGDFSQRAEVRTRDEIGVLGTAFDAAIDQLQQNELKNQHEREESQKLQNNIGSFLDVTMDIADGDLTRRGQVTEDVLGNVVDSINLMVDELSAVLRNVQQASQSVTSGAQAMLGTTGDIAQGSTATLTEAQRVQVRVEELTAAIRQMADNAAASAAAAQQALMASAQGQDAVQGTLGGMQNIRAEVQDVARRIKGLSDRSLEIQEIVDTIGRIASQTNLLALNAAIEAAGAGEAGSRFAVVADEVRKLAESSAQATARIAALIKNVQAEIGEVVASVEGGTREVESGYRVATTAGERLREIGELSQQSAELAGRISRATQEQVRGVEQVGTAVGEIAQIAQQSATSVQRGQQAADDLKALAQELDGSLQRFRLPG